LRTNKPRIYKYEIYKQIIRRPKPNVEENVRTQFREVDCDYVVLPLGGTEVTKDRM
jgi:hypothetical protein